MAMVERVDGEHCPVCYETGCDVGAHAMHLTTTDHEETVETVMRWSEDLLGEAP